LFLFHGGPLFLPFICFLALNAYYGLLNHYAIRQFAEVKTISGNGFTFQVTGKPGMMSFNSSYDLTINQKIKYCLHLSRQGCRYSRNSRR
jgi:hypothetical protein